MYKIMQFAVKDVKSGEEKLENGRSLIAGKEEGRKTLKQNKGKNRYGNHMSTVIIMKPNTT